MGVIGFIWGIGGIIMLLGFAISRLSGMIFELDQAALSLWQWAILLFWLIYMVWAEGYKGFYKAFAPRVVVRANYLAANPRLLHVLLAPLFCMGYIHATAKRRMVSIALTTMIICFVLMVRLLPQPWRGIVDVGVVAGLGVGVLSILFFVFKLRQSGAASLPASPDVPV
ncbi:hypothetical protein GCM10011403_04490 [Pseudohongiella nitratireducens]|uniref:Uncharacterized protein n=2 Tax=Pseudohongiella nitratireducens TaxID=1768907 RepID=A0A917LPR7_9GAMM|nr:hypothetical protein GCM10011403_04490 [Pseudohongiella nitratireducens]